MSQPELYIDTSIYYSGQDIYYVQDVYLYPLFLLFSMILVLKFKGVMPNKASQMEKIPKNNKHPRTYIRNRRVLIVIFSMMRCFFLLICILTIWLDLMKSSESYFLNWAILFKTKSNCQKLEKYLIICYWFIEYK